MLSDTPCGWIVISNTRDTPFLLHRSPAASTLSTPLQTFQERQPRFSRPSSMSGIAANLQHLREKNQGLGTNSQAVKYLNQDYEVLLQRCFESGHLFQDDTFPALTSSLGFKELGPGSYKTRGVSWKRPTVSQKKSLITPQRLVTKIRLGPHARLHLEKGRFKADQTFNLVLGARAHADTVLLFRHRRHLRGLTNQSLGCMTAGWVEKRSANREQV